MDLERLAAVIFGLVSGVVVLFQLALAAGAPWGVYAMGGAFPGRFPPAMRVAALVQAVLIAALGLLMLSSAGIVSPSLVRSLPWLVWVPVVVAGLALVMNAASRSAGERRLWVPVAAVLLVTSLLVALSAGPG